MLIDGLFAPLMWLGSVSILRGGAPAWWPLVVGFAAGLLRVFATSQSLDALVVLISLVAPAFLAASAWMMWQAPGQVRFGRTIAAFFGVLVAVELADAIIDATRSENCVQYELFAALGLPLAAIQIA